jgi:hypothetical protein
LPQKGQPLLRNAGDGDFTAVLPAAPTSWQHFRLVDRT